MIYLSGSVRSGNFGVGWMLQPGMGNKLPPGDIWAADNGCFSKTATFDADRWLAWLDHFTPTERGTCLFATAPDVVGDMEATLARSLPWFSAIRMRGFRPALVAQDGAESLELPWDEFDALFVGGTTEWKLSVRATALAREAKRRGKWVHMGRVNSRRRLTMATLDGYDSVDGTYAAFRARGGGGDRGLREISAWCAQETFVLSGPPSPLKERND